jgi:shikimate dehydrogenase
MLWSVLALDVIHVCGGGVATITGKTSILLMLARPVAHVRGSALINRSFDDMGLDATIAPLHVRPADLQFTLPAARRMQNVAGLSLTIPHKIPALQLIDTAPMPRGG